MPKRIPDLPPDYEEYQYSLARDIGKRIRNQRISLGLSQEKLRTKLELERVYISRTQFSRIENGESLPGAAEIVALANALDVSPNWLLLGHD